MTATRRYRLPALMLAGALLAAGCGSGGGVKSGNSGPLETPDNALNHPIGGTVTIDNESGTLWTCGFSPFNAAVQFLSVGVVYEPLYFVNILKNGAETPWLASSYQWAKNNTELTFKIRPGVKWSDGIDFTAADVVYTFNLTKTNPALDQVGAWAVLSSVAQRGNDQVVFTFANPAVPYFYNIADQVGIVPQHIWSKIADPVNELDAAPVGTGPYTVGACTQQNIEYVRNPSYWQPGLPRIAKVEYPAFLSNDAANNVLAAGKADWGSQFIPNIDAVYSSKGKNRRYWFPAVLNVELVPNLTVAPFDNVKVRQAIAYAIDRPAIAKKGEAGYQPPGNQSGVVLPTYKDWYNQSLATQSQYNYVYNPDKARALLKDAGFTKGSDGVLADQSGKKLAFNIIVNSGYSDWIASLHVIEDELSAVGIQATTSTLGQTDFTNAVVNGQFDMAYDSTGSAGPSPYYELRALLYGANSAPVGQPAATNYGRYMSKSTDALIDQYGSAGDQAAQHHILDQLQEVMLKEVPFIPVTGAVDWYQYDTTHIGGWVTQNDPYAQPAAFAVPDWEVMLLHLYQK